jgi:hypothetical protein
MGAAGSLDEVIACHERYLAAIQKQCLVASDKLVSSRPSLLLLLLGFILIGCTLLLLIWTCRSAQ